MKQGVEDRAEDLYERLARLTIDQPTLTEKEARELAIKVIANALYDEGHIWVKSARDAMFVWITTELLPAAESD